ncbi:PspA/IM30 protein [Desulfitobacterium hafniense]|uniref:PspA/IM30 protein n=1 Tax=Desulfitobacterium hafniense TaxID=49338 RepID=A0A098B7D5_DESHA|nr:PspA/IM30 family protein [Desulfitobacterium hafniense]CDX04793.1 PspA/IM30 protein [Desulfitobacterium hafniense]
MGLLNRVKDLFQANVTDMLNKTEDPEKMLNFYVEKASEDVRNFRIQVNRAIADKIQLEERISNLQKEITERAEQATLAVQQGKDELARTALTLKKQAETSLADFELQLADQAKAVEELQENLRTLTEKLEKAKQERNNLVLRQRRAKTMKDANEAISGIATQDPMANFDRMKERVERIEAEAKASNIILSTENSLEDQLTDLKKDQEKSAIEDELLKLKSEVNKD